MITQIYPHVATPVTYFLKSTLIFIPNTFIQFLLYPWSNGNPSYDLCRPYRDGTSHYIVCLKILSQAPNRGQPNTYCSSNHCFSIYDYSIFYAIIIQSIFLISSLNLDGFGQPIVICFPGIDIDLACIELSDMR